MVEKTTRTLQVILGAMAVGVAVFLGIVVFVIPPAGQGQAQEGRAGLPGPVAALPVISVVAYTVTAILLPLSFVAPAVVAESLRKKRAAGKTGPAKGSPMTDDRAALAEIYQTRMILGAALTEAPAFLATVAYMIERNPMAMGLALALLGVMVMRVPTVPRVAFWVDAQHERLEADRAVAGLG